MSNSRQYISFLNYLSDQEVPYHEYYRGTPKYVFWDQFVGSLSPFYDIQNDFFDTFKRYKSGYAIFLDLVQPIRGLGNIILGVINLLFVPIAFVLKSFWYCFTPSTFLENMKTNGIQLVTWLLEGAVNIFRGVTQIISTPLTWIRIPFRAIFIKKISLPPPTLDFSELAGELPESILGLVSTVKITTKLLAEDGIRHIFSFLDGYSAACVQQVSRSFNFQMKQAIHDKKYWPSVIQQEVSSQEIVGERKSEFFLDYYKRTFKLRLNIKRCLANSKTPQKELNSLFAEIIYEGCDQLIPLLQHKIDPSTVLEDKNGIANETFVHIAAARGKLNSLRWLLDHGAPVDMRDQGTTGEGEIMTWHPGHGATPLHRAAGAGHLDSLLLLLDHHANIDATRVDTNETALHYAARNGHLVCIQALMNQGARLNIKNDEGLLPVHLAQKNAHSSCAAEMTSKMRELQLPIPPDPTLRRGHFF